MGWRFINTEENNGFYNMALDEAILRCVSYGKSLPTIRFYKWNPAAISLGVFQSAKKEIDFLSCKKNGIDIVRRLTGGRAVLHDKELTYSIIVPESYNNISDSINESYRYFSEGLVQGYKNLGISASVAIKCLKKPKDLTSAACFDAPSNYEIVVRNKKIVGSAQVRKMGVILQHGSILYKLDNDKLFSCFNYDSEEKRDRIKQIFSTKATCINDVLEREVSWDELCEAFFKGFEQGLRIKLQVDELTSAERDMANELLNKYTSQEWVVKK